MSSNNTTQAFCLRRATHPTDLVRDFSIMLEDDDLTDVTICCEDGNIQAHRMFLSANSPYFKSIFTKLSSTTVNNRNIGTQYPVLVLKDISLMDMRAIVEFIYRGEVTVPQSQLPSVLKSAESLKIRGLNGVENIPDNTSSNANNNSGGAGPTGGTGGKKGRKRKKRRKSSRSAGSTDGDDATAGTEDDDEDAVDPGDSGNDGISTDEEDEDASENRTSITAIDSAGGDGLEPSRLLEQSMVVTGDSNPGGRSAASGAAYNTNGMNLTKPKLTNGHHKK